MNLQGETSEIRPPRATTNGLIGLVLAVPLGLVALRSASELSAGAVFLATCAVLTLAVVGVACRQGAGRAWWLGFALFGWGTLAPAFWGVSPWPEVPTNALIDFLRARLGPSRLQAVRGIDPFATVGHCLLSLVAATLGGLLARRAWGAPEGRCPERRAEAQVPRWWWCGPALVGLAGLVMATCVVLVGVRRAPESWAAEVPLLTWSVLGLAAVIAACGRGRCRAALGAALFGIGTMTLTLDRDPAPPRSPYVATGRYLNDALRPLLLWVVKEFPAESDTIAASNARILKALDQPSPLRFPGETSLEDVLAATHAVTRGPDGRGIAIHVDPVALRESRNTMQSTIKLAIEGLPLGTSLRLALHQIGMRYRVTDGVLLITSGQDRSVPLYDDSFLLVGHCLLAVLAAALGGTLAPLVCGLPGQPA